MAATSVEMYAVTPSISDDGRNASAAQVEHLGPAQVVRPVVRARRQRAARRRRRGRGLAGRRYRQRTGGGERDEHEEPRGPPRPLCRQREVRLDQQRVGEQAAEAAEVAGGEQEVRVLGPAMVAPGVPPLEQRPGGRHHRERQADHQDQRAQQPQRGRGVRRAARRRPGSPAAARRTAGAARPGAPSAARPGRAGTWTSARRRTPGAAAPGRTVSSCSTRSRTRRTTAGSVSRPAVARRRAGPLRRTRWSRTGRRAATSSDHRVAGSPARSRRVDHALADRHRGLPGGSWPTI